MKQQLTKEIAYTALQDFFSQKPFVLFATGTSCTVDVDFGMGALETYLREEIPGCLESDAQEKEWERVIKELGDHSDFEKAMNAVRDETLVSIVIQKTAEHVQLIEKRHAYSILCGKTDWPAIKLFSRLVKRLPETDRTLHVATPNYDLLAEYAFTRAEIPYSTGFSGGVLRTLDWELAERQMRYIEKGLSGKSRIQRKIVIKKHVRLYKVHGSLNTFVHEGRVVETDMWQSIPNGVERLMITPGRSKHERLHDNRDTLLRAFDRAVREHSAFLFLGFGFNDTQLVTNAIEEKLKNKAVPALIITRDSNPRIDALLEESPGTWLVCKHPEAKNHSTIVKNANYCDLLHLPDKMLWRFDQFADEILGG